MHEHFKEGCMNKYVIMHASIQVMMHEHMRECTIILRDECKHTIDGMNV